MIGAIIGDIVGSVYEFNNVLRVDFPLFSKESCFTDDTVLTVATADALLNNLPFRPVYQDYYHRYPEAGYGGRFAAWAQKRQQEPYGSFGNGSAMRVSPVGFYLSRLEDVLMKAKESAIVSHNHPEGIKGAQAVAAAVFLARNGESKATIASYVTDAFAYDLSQPLNEVRHWYKFDVTCQGSVPYAISAFLESSDFTEAIRLAISIGGDSDTLACMAGAMAEAYYQDIPKEIKDEALNRLPADLLAVTLGFEKAGQSDD